MAKNNETVVTLHTHGWNNHNPARGVLGSLSELPILWYEGPHTGRAVLKTCARKFPDTNTLIALTNNTTSVNEVDYLFYDWIVYDFLHDPDYKGKIDDNNRQAFIRVEDNGIDRVIIRANEPCTKEGHFLSILLEKDIRPGPLEDCLKRSREAGAIIGADHPLMLSNYVIERASFPKKQVLQLMRKLGDFMSEGGRMSVGIEGIERFRDYWEFLELSSNCLELEPLVRQVAEDYGLPLVASDDAHTLRKMFSSHTVMCDLDYKSSDIEKLRASLRRALVSPKTRLVTGSNSYDKLIHVVIDAYNQILRLPLGLLKREPIIACKKE